MTSGIYERAFEQDGKLYHHILDPRTGFPAETDLLSATVVAQSSLDADGYTTALIMMEPIAHLRSSSSIRRSKPC